MSLSRFLLVLLLLAGNAMAQEWPSRVVKFVSPYPPGGSVDPLARLLAAKLTDSLRQQIIVENRTGASGIIGTEYVAKSAPDGYTFVFIFDTHTVHQALNPKLPFDPIRDFAPVMLVGTAPMVIATAAAKPYQNWGDVIKAAKAKPDSLSFGSIGNGSLGHLTMILVQQAAGIKLVHVPYKGGGPMTTDAIGGQTDLAIGSVAVITPHVKGGKLRAIAVTGQRRSNALPDVVTLSEQGFPGFLALAWWGVFAPAGTPKPILDKFHAELVKALNQPDVRKTLTETLGMDLVVSTPDALQKFLLAEMSRWGKVVKDNNIRPD